MENKKQLKEKINILMAMIKILRKLLALLQKKKDYYAFQEALGQRESGGNYRIVNAYGYLGKFQFGMARLCDLGYTERKAGMTGYNNSVFQWKTGYSEEYFLNNPDFQDRVFKQHCRNLIARIKKSFSGYLGERINGIEITLSGLVAGAHLGGIGGIKNFLKGYDSQDQLGTSISSYVKKFNGYNLENL